MAWLHQGVTGDLYTPYSLKSFWLTLNYLELHYYYY